MKGTARVVSAGVFAAGLYLVVTELLHTPITISKEEASSQGEYNNKIGKDYERFLVSPFNSHNRIFWHSSLKRYKKDKSNTPNKTFSSDFTGIERFFVEKTDSSTGADKALNRICEEIYKKAKSDIEGENHKDLKSDLFTYCSILQENPQTIKEADTIDNKTTYSDNQIGKTKEDKLLSVDVNEKTWELKTKDFFNGNKPEDTHKFFFEFYKNNKNDSLKTRCGEAYQKNSSDASSSDASPSDEEVLKYCSLLGSYSSNA